MLYKKYLELANSLELYQINRDNSMKERYSIGCYSLYIINMVFYDEFRDYLYYFLGNKMQE